MKTLYRIAKVKGKKDERVFFYAGERSDRPENKNCRRKSYVTRDDEVIVSRTFGNWACSLYQPKKGYETVGWIAVNKLEFLETKTDVSKNDWLGDWTYFGDWTDDDYRSSIKNTIRIGTGKADQFLSIKGDANWSGPDDNAHKGELDYEAKQNGNILKIDDTDDDGYRYKVTMRLVGKFLIAEDNRQCGGLYVSFSGVYQRK